MVWPWICFLILNFANASDIQFEKGQIKIGEYVIQVEFAKTPEQWERGLMHRKSMPENSGMLFIFQDEELHTFWMKNTFIPLSLGYFDRNKKLTEVLEMKPVQSEMQIDIPKYPSKYPALYVLEMNQNWFSKHNVKPGMTFSILKSDTKNKR